MNNYIAKTVFEKIKKVTKIKKLFLHEPTLSRLELKAVNDCIKTGVVSSSGKQVELFEKKLSKFSYPHPPFSFACGVLKTTNNSLANDGQT